MSDSMIYSIDRLDGDVFGVLARTMPSRLIEISRSGCLLESGHRVENGTVGELRLEVDGELLVDDVRVTRCVRVEGSGSSYLVGAEFLQTRRPGEYSIRRAVIGILHGRAQHLNQAKNVSSNGATGAAIAAEPVVNSESPGDRRGVMKELFARFVREDEGQDLIEYGLLAGIITATVVGLITTIGTRVLDFFTRLDTALDAAP